MKCADIMEETRLKNQILMAYLFILFTNFIIIKHYRQILSDKACKLTKHYIQ